jgi:RNA-splicing ligase RtcB
MKRIKNNKGIETIIFAETFEYEAYDQIKKLVNFEAYENAKVRIMPDAHAGKGCTVGTTMVITDKITPNLVGVDIGCLDKDTEFLTPNGWKNISNFNDELVLQYNKETNIGSFVKPINYIVKDCDYFFHFKNTKGLDQMLSSEHKMLIWKGYKSKGYSLCDMNPNDVISLGDKLNNGYYGIKSSVNIDNKGVNMSEIEIRMDVMIAADGTLRKNDVIELHFTKKRKITRAKVLLNISGFEYSENIGNDGSTYFRFKSNGNFNKDLSKYYLANKPQLEILAEESLLWDGHKGYRSFYSSTNKKNADVIQFAFTCIDVRAGISVVKSDKDNWNDVYVVTPTQNNIIGITNTIEKVKSIDGKKYCFTVPSGYFLARRNGKVFITGNCGMLTIKLKDTEINFNKVDRIIKTKVPHGFNVHKTSMKHFDFSNLRCKKHVDLNRALLSIGSLGGGNHFIEIGKHEVTGEIYLIIHSGSRKLGGDVCKYYQDKAFKNANEMSTIVQNTINKLKSEGREKEIADEIKKIRKPRTDKELAFLIGSDFDDYMNDMAIVQKFATQNREMMAEIILRECGLSEAERFETIHNYIDFKRMILRKGAVSAEKGEMLLIPINMRDGSLLCVGKGNEDWNYSAPHGAGRLMSRSKAKENIDINEFVESMKDVHTTSVDKGTLDEAPQAYKSIDEIKNAITNTVDIVGVIKPLYNFKSH